MKKTLSISLVINFLLVILVCVAGMKIEDMKAALAIEPVAIYIEKPVMRVFGKPIPITLLDIRYVELPPVEVEKIIYVDKEVEYVDKELSPFSSVDELEQFLLGDDTDIHIFLTADSDGVVTYDGQCEDFAFQLRDRAKEIGKLLETETMTKAECVKYRQYIDEDISVLGANDGHYINKAVIGNEVWFVEPGNDRIWLAYYLD